ncbi:MAG: O-antigen ligase family protein [Caldilineaceae bacterium]|nr:O-antigen ligase family protein [Caldilineaceae bacterium]
MTLRTKLDHWCEAVIEAGWLAALIVAPMFFNVFSSRVFEPDKISLIRSIALVMLLGWVVKVANGGSIWLPAYAQDSTAQTANDGEAISTWQARWAVIWRSPFFIPVVLLVVAYLLSTVFSLARFVSWFGSYQRLQGTYSFLSYVIIAFLTAAHLRRPEQLWRLQHVIIITSLAISIYGVIQHYDIDPLPWGGDVTVRIAANAGNAIFLAAYLIMAFFFTLERVYNSFALLLGNYPREAQENQELPIALAGGAYLFILMVQALAIFWTQSRGPWLGLFFGFYLFVLLVITSLRPRHYRQLTAGWVGLGMLGAIVLILMNTTGLFSFLQGVPYVGRLTTLLDSESRTGQVRVLIWEGASHMVAPHAPLIFPDGEEDTINLIRPLVGYGPEAMWVAYNPFYPPELAHWERRNASPDRSHNETWDSLVITGLFGFVAYMSLFLSVFYWALRWLGLLVNRRDNFLFAGLLAVSSLIFIVLFMASDDWQWRFLGASLPAGLMVGLFLYVTIAAFLHTHETPDATQIPRQLLIITVLATIAAHFIEIHFGIAIAATRTYFWVQAALLLVLGMRWAQPAPFSAAQLLTPADIAAEPAAEPEPTKEPVEEEPKKSKSQSRRRGKNRQSRSRSAGNQAANDRSAGSHSPPRPTGSTPGLPATVMTDLLVFLTFVFIYTTNGTQARDTLSVLFNSILRRPEGGELVSSPAIFFLMVFTWLLSAIVGLASESLAQRRAPEGSWWIKNFLLHTGIIWGGWLIYGLIQAARLVPGAGGNTLDEQLAHVAGHFAIYTWIVVIWIVAAATVYAWPYLRERTLQFAKHPAVSLVAAVFIAIFVFFVISTVNVALVRADIIYKQGQQFDNQRNWISSIELYRRALAARKTEDHYMLFLGRALLEQAKDAGVEGAFAFPENPNVDDVLDLRPEQVQQMSRVDLLRAAEAVLLEAQRVNPLNTDHTANLARLYRSWADLSTDPAIRDEMLKKSVDMYDVAVTLSPNAAHLWNEKGNAHLADGQDEQAEAAYRHSLSIDPLFEQTYLLLSDFLNRRERYEEATELLEEGIRLMDESSRFQPTAQMYSFLGVAYARIGQLEKAIDANLHVLELQPNNIVAIRNLALLYRDNGQSEKALEWLEQTFPLLGPDNASELRQLRVLAAQIYQEQENTAKVIEQYEAIRVVLPEDLEVLKTLSNLYNTVQDDRKVVEIAQALMALEPGNYQHPFNIAQALQRVGQTENARQFGEQALSLAPDDQKPAIEAFLAGLGE